MSRLMHKMDLNKREARREWRAIREELRTNRRQAEDFRMAMCIRELSLDREGSAKRRKVKDEAKKHGNDEPTVENATTARVVQAPRETGARPKTRPAAKQPKAKEKSLARSKTRSKAVQCGEDDGNDLETMQRINEKIRLSESIVGKLAVELDGFRGLAKKLRTDLERSRSIMKQLEDGCDDDDDEEDGYYYYYDYDYDDDDSNGEEDLSDDDNDDNDNEMATESPPEDNVAKESGMLLIETF